MYLKARFHIVICIVYFSEAYSVMKLDGKAIPLYLNKIQK